MFEINYQLCKEFPAFTPIEVDNTRYVDVINIFKDVRKMQIREKKRNDPNRVVRRPAGNNWF